MNINELVKQIKANELFEKLNRNVMAVGFSLFVIPAIILMRNRNANNKAVSSLSEDDKLLISQMKGVKGELKKFAGFLLNNEISNCKEVAYVTIEKIQEFPNHLLSQYLTRDELIMLSSIKNYVRDHVNNPNAKESEVMGNTDFSRIFQFLKNVFIKFARSHNENRRYMIAAQIFDKESEGNVVENHVETFEQMKDGTVVLDVVLQKTQEKLSEYNENATFDIDKFKPYNSEEFQNFFKDLAWKMMKIELKRHKNMFAGIERQRGDSKGSYHQMGIYHLMNWVAFGNVQNTQEYLLRKLRHLLEDGNSNEARLEIGKYLDDNQEYSSPDLFNAFCTIEQRPSILQRKFINGQINMRPVMIVVGSFLNSMKDGKQAETPIATTPLRNFSLENYLNTIKSVYDHLNGPLVASSGDFRDIVISGFIDMIAKSVTSIKEMQNKKTVQGAISSKNAVKFNELAGNFEAYLYAKFVAKSEDLPIYEEMLRPESLKVIENYVAEISSSKRETKHQDVLKQQRQQEENQFCIIQ